MSSNCQDQCCSDKSRESDSVVTVLTPHSQKSSTERTYCVDGMDCGSCAVTIENHLKAHARVQTARVHFSSGKMTVEHDLTDEQLIHEVTKLGFQAAVLTTGSGEAREEGKGGLRSDTRTVVLSGLMLLLGVMGSYMDVPSIVITVLYALSIIVGGYKPARSAYYAVRSRSLDMNVLMTTAALGAAAIGEWLEGATVVWLFALGNMLQARSMEKTRQSIRSLLELAPAEANVKRGNQLIRLGVKDVAIGDIIVVKPGEKIPLDGEVVAGESSVNQAPITGESIPADKQPGDLVYAGTINVHGSLEVKVTKWVQDTTIAKIIHLVEEAQEQKAPTEAFIDQFAKIYTPIVFLLALAVMVVPPLLGAGAWKEWLYKGLELLVIACPCALVISTPVAIVSAIGQAAKNGVLIKGGTYLEIAGSLSAIAFDKTGTLTEGTPFVTQVIVNESTEEELLTIAYTLEAYSTHPIAKAIVDYATTKGLTPQPGKQFRNRVGQGVEAVIGEMGRRYYAGNVRLFRELQHEGLAVIEDRVRALQQEGQTIVIIGTEQHILGVLAVADRVRDTSVQAIQDLQRVGIEQLVMLTGDTEGSAKKVALESGIHHFSSELLPEQKVSAIQQLQKNGHRVAMVGDGINDAPALATADLGIAMGGAGTDTAMQTANMVLMADNLVKLAYSIKLSRQAIRIIKQNIWFSLIIKAAAFMLIFPELLTLWIAVLSDTGAAVLVILNSMRLLRVKA
ncbi:cation-translocating P-type ATPase [Paenibacillus sp. YYML68]|uniref:heavy metal translocating P-type ATPase n=1 Tax=Paenibacillus sp. YYML68 TaxID=2909250 RepID=UPI0024925993|nr:heavy metal translocating P-type ATPase [Paenibacillus sp. YYML68]